MPTDCGTRAQRRPRPHRLDARLVAGAVPVALLASVHLLLRLVVRALAWTTATAATTAATVTPAAPANHPAAARRGAPSARANDRSGTRRRLADTRVVYDRLAATGRPVSWRQFAQAFTPPMPKRTAQRHLAHHTRTATGTAAPTATSRLSRPESVP